MVSQKEITDLYARVIKIRGAMSVIANRAGLTKQAVSYCLRGKAKCYPNAGIIREARKLVKETELEYQKI